MATASVDIPRVAGFTSIPQDQVNQLLTSPTTELVRQLLLSISKKSKEFEEAASSRIKLRVELENTNRSHEAKLKVVRSSLDQAKEENIKLREQLKTSEALKQSVTAELELVKSSSSSADSESNILRARIAALESSQQDSVVLIEKKSAAYDELANELSAKHEKTIELRKEVATLEQSLASITSKSNSWKIREQELQHEVEALRTHNEWLDQELKTRNSEHSKFRKDKNARLSELQQQYEDAASTIEASQRVEQVLRARLEEISQKSEENLRQIQTLREDNARKEDSYRSELDTANRLAELLQESLDTQRHRAEDLSAQLEDDRRAAADEIGRINAEIEIEHEEKLEAQRRVAELEVEVERLAEDAEVAKRQPIIPNTPKTKVNGSIVGSPRNGSPMPGSRGGLNYTQLVNDYHAAKSELEKERRRTQQLDAQLQEIMHDIELRQPEIDAMETEHDRLESDIVQLTKHLDVASQERDASSKDQKKLEREVYGLTKEGDLLRQQLRDLSSQIKVLLMEAHSKDAGISNLSSEQRAALEAIAQGDLDGDGAAPVTDTHRFISEHLTTFRHIDELQENNAKLLRLTRELGEQMEGEEAQQEKAQAAQNREDLLDLRTKFDKAKDEIRILTTQSNSYIKERDMFRRMLSHRGKLPAGDHTLNFAESINGSMPPSTPLRRDSIAAFDSPSSKEMTDLTKAIKELQSQYDTYRSEAAQHQTILKQQSDTLAQHNSELRNEVSKRTNEATLAVDRYELLQGNYTMLKNENQELQKRSQSLSERASKQEIKTQQVAEDVVEAKSLAESLRNENANLKAEREFWKTVEKRLNDEVTSLTADRDRLNILNTNLQSILNDKEHTDTESRRRLQNQIEALEADLQNVRQKLNDEMEENKRGAFRREYEAQQSSTRTEELVTTLSNVREELVAAQTTGNHLQSRVEELTIELRNAQETLNVYKPSPSQPQSTTDNITKEQELTIQVSELKRELDLTRKELADNETLIEQFKAISQNAEEELQNMNEAYDQYRQETDAQLEERANKITEVEGIIDTLRSEIRDINAELTAAAEKGSEHSQQLETQRSSHESELAQLKDSIERAQAAVQYHQEDLRKQAEIAQQAQENYDNELLKHAEAAKALQILRSELSQVKLETIEYRTAAESAESKLQQNQESWTEIKERYERELQEIRMRRDDAATQNRLLHAQLENVNKNIGDLRQKRSSEIGVSTLSSAGETDNENLNELVKYLQKEKTIVDTQYLRAQQESKRLQQQLEHTQSQLDDVRLKLAQEQKSTENTERQVLNHNKLMETLQELNLYRESNTTLRLEKQQVEVTLHERNSNLETLQAQILPLQARIAELEESKDLLEADVRLATEAKDRFEKRYLDILNRSNAVDPAEFESIKQKLVELEVERDQLVQSRDALQQEVDAQPGKLHEELESQRVQNEERMAKFKDQAKEKNRTQNATIKDKDTALQIALQEKNELASQLQSVQQQLEEANLAKIEAESKMAEQATALAAVADAPVQMDTTNDIGPSVEFENAKAQLAEAQGKVESESRRATELSEKLATAEQTITQLRAEITSLTTSLNAAKFSTTDNTPQLQAVPVTEDPDAQQNSNAALQASIEKANAEIDDLKLQLQQAGQASSSPPAIDPDQAFAELQAQLRQLETEAEELKAKLQAFETAKEISDDGEISIADQIAPQIELIRQELTRRHEDRVKLEEERFRKRADKMKEALNKQMSKLKDESRVSTGGPSQEVLDNLKKAHAIEIQSLNQRHANEIAELKRLAKPASEAVVANAATPSKFEPSEEQIRDLLKNNAYARKLIQNSMDNRSKKLQEEAQIRHDELLRKSQAEQAVIAQNEVLKVRAEEQSKIESLQADVGERLAKAKEDAEALTKKKFDVKFSMAENKLSRVEAKWAFVEKAAKETPEETVNKIWTLAKDAKPAPKAIPAAPVSQSPASVQSQAAQASAISPPATTPAPVATATSTEAAQPQANTNSSTKLNPPSSTTQTTTIPRPTGLAQPSAPIAGQPAGMAALGLTVPKPAPSTGMQQSQHARGGRGGSAIPRGGATRGRGASGIPRGGRGGGTAAAKPIDTTTTPTAAANAAGSPKTPINPAAAQFVPGQKRALDGSDDAGNEKRAKKE